MAKVLPACFDAGLRGANTTVVSAAAEAQACVFGRRRVKGYTPSLREEIGQHNQPAGGQCRKLGPSGFSVVRQQRGRRDTLPTPLGETGARRGEDDASASTSMKGLADLNCLKIETASFLPSKLYSQSQYSVVDITATPPVRKFVTATPSS